MRNEYMSYIQYIDSLYIRYIFPPRRIRSYWLIKQMFIIDYLWERYKKEKYYKGIDSILYFPYISDNKRLKEVPHVTIPYYYGLKANNIIFEDILGLLKEDKK